MTPERATTTKRCDRSSRKTSSSHEPGVESYSSDYLGPDALIDHFDRLLEQTEGTFRVEQTDVIETEDYAATRISWFAERGGVRSEGLELAVVRSSRRRDRRGLVLPGLVRSRHAA